MTDRLPPACCCRIDRMSRGGSRPDAKVNPVGQNFPVGTGIAPRPIVPGIRPLDVNQAGPQAANPHQEIHHRGASRADRRRSVNPHQEIHCQGVSRADRRLDRTTHCGPANQDVNRATRQAGMSHCDPANRVANHRGVTATPVGMNCQASRPDETHHRAIRQAGMSHYDPANQVANHRGVTVTPVGMNYQASHRTGMSHCDLATRVANHQGVTVTPVGMNRRASHRIGMSHCDLANRVANHLAWTAIPVGMNCQASRRAGTSHCGLANRVVSRVSPHLAAKNRRGATRHPAIRCWNGLEGRHPVGMNHREVRKAGHPTHRQRAGENGFRLILHHRFARRHPTKTRGQNPVRTHRQKASENGFPRASRHSPLLDQTIDRCRQEAKKGRAVSHRSNDPTNRDVSLAALLTEGTRQLYRLLLFSQTG